MKHVVVIAALDTKGDEARLIRDQVAGRGHRPVMVDVGVLADPAAPADVPARAVAEAGGASLDDLRRTGDKSAAMEAMTRGAAVVAARLQSEGRLDGVVAIGGSAGTAIGTSAMRALPVGVPKLMVSTVAAGGAAADRGLHVRQHDRLRRPRPGGARAGRLRGDRLPRDRDRRADAR